MAKKNIGAERKGNRSLNRTIYKRTIAGETYSSWGNPKALFQSKKKAIKRAGKARKVGSLVRTVKIKGGWVNIGRGGRKKKVN